MSNSPLDELGPVDYVIVEFPAGAANFTGEMADELISLVDAGTIRIIDILVLVKDDDGDVEAMELADLDDSVRCRSSRPSSPSCWPRRMSSTSPPRWTPAASPAS